MLRNPGLINQFFRYSIVGGIASVVDISIFSVGVNVFGINHIISNSLSLTTGLVVNYLLSSKWVFSIRQNYIANFILFSVIGLVGFLLSNVLIYIMLDFRVLYHLLSSAKDSLVKPSAKIIATGIVLLWNFAARRKLAVSQQV